jgi:hypothetical protein
VVVGGQCDEGRGYERASERGLRSNRGANRSVRNNRRDSHDPQNRNRKPDMLPDLVLSMLCFYIENNRTSIDYIQTGLWMPNDAVDPDHSMVSIEPPAPASSPAAEPRMPKSLRSVVGSSRGRRVRVAQFLLHRGA